ncbi:MAG TPA: DCC1-like thiol-disulfide oxidoreductase family protein [Roseomonas sp.]
MQTGSLRTAGPVIVFDTDCVLCSGMVAFLLRHERDRCLRFAGAWSEEGQALAARHGFSKLQLDETFLLIADGQVLTRSDAGLAILRHMRAPWRWLGVLRLVPRPLRDAVYRFVARRRYRWFGQRENCTLVPAGARDRFIGVRGLPPGAP